MTICYMYCGADNVGKTTLLLNQMQSRLFANRGKYLQHFGAPKNLAKPFEQYYDFLSDHIAGKEVLFCDRGFIDTYFYSQYRDGTNVSQREFEQILKFWKDSFIVFVPIIVRRPWESIERFHKEELANSIGSINEGTSLVERKNEYMAYYDFMENLVEQYPEILYLDLIY